jgi:hypothetical protein
MRDLAALALATLRALLEDPKTPPTVRLKTALAVLQRPHFPDRGWHLPERIEERREQQAVDNLAEMKADYDAMRMSDAMAAQRRGAGPRPALVRERNAVPWRPSSCGSFRVWIYSANAPRHMSTHNARMRRVARRLNQK